MDLKLFLRSPRLDRFVFCDSNLSFFWSLGSDRSFSDSYGKTIKDSKVLPVIFAKLFSSSAATGFLLDIYKTSGADSLAGFMSSVILSSTETCFYTLSVYYSVVGIKKIRYTLTGALLAVFVGTFISVFISYF